MSTNKQGTSYPTSTSDYVELEAAFEDAGGLSPAEYQNQLPLRLFLKRLVHLNRLLWLWIHWSM